MMRTRLPAGSVTETPCMKLGEPCTASRKSASFCGLRRHCTLKRATCVVNCSWNTSLMIFAAPVVRSKANLTENLGWSSMPKRPSLVSPMTK